MAYHITREKYGACTQYAGFVTGTELLQSVFDYQGDPDFDRWRYAIKDFLQVTGHSVCPADVTLVTAYGLGAEFTNPNIKIAIVSRDQCIRDLVKGFAARSHYPVGFFDTVAQARAWVDQRCP